MPPTLRRLLAAASALTLTSGLLTLSAPSASAATAAPDIAKLAGSLASQTLTWQTCDFGAQQLNDRWASLPNVRCATVTVPRDWKNPGNGKTWSIRISQAVNIDASNPRSKGVILGNPGGPGGAGLSWGPYLSEFLSDLRPYYNFVGMDPRGVGQSSHATCRYQVDASSTDPYADSKAIGAQCAQNEDVRTITTEQTAYDMDLIRHLLGQKKLGYVGYSYGTWLGSWYAKVFAPNAGPMLLDSSTDVTEPTLQPTWEMQPIARDRQFDMRMLHWIARHDDVYHLGQDPSAIRQRYFAAAAKLDPLTVLMVWFYTNAYNAFPNNDTYPLAGDVVSAIIEYGESDTAAVMARAKPDPALTANAVLARASAKATTPTVRDASARAEASLNALAQAAPRAAAAPRMVTRVFDDVFEMIRCGDGQWTQGERYWQAQAQRTAPQAPFSASWGAFDVPVCAFWQTSTMNPVAPADYPKTIVVQGELDSQTAWETGYTSGVKLPRTSAIFVDNEGSHGLFPYGSECLDRPVIDFFLKGRMPQNITVCQGLPLPRDSKTYESWAKLDERGRHVAVPPGPWTPAVTATKTLPADRALLTTGTAESQSLLRSTIRARYGMEGLRALEQAGVLARS